MVTFEVFGGLIGGILFFMFLAGYVGWRTMRNNTALNANRVPRVRIAGQIRTKGVGPLVLDSIPIVRFGNRNKQLDATSKDKDIELGEVKDSSKADSTVVSDAAATKETTVTEGIQALPEIDTPANSTAQTTFQENQCAICICDFVANEEVRVLPCNHRYHPECVDPWLLNISGTCPICRWDLRPNDPESRQVIIPPDGDYLPVNSPIGYIRVEALRQEADRMEAYLAFQAGPTAITVPPPTLASPRDRMSIRSRLREIGQSSSTGPEYLVALGRFYHDSEGRKPSLENRHVR